MRFFLRRLLIPVFCLFWALTSNAQNELVTYDMGCFISFYSPAIKNPLYVTYHLYKGSGTFDRSGMNFRKCGQETASPSDYTNSGSTRGHLVPAQDFAYNREAMNLTFCMCNIVPQTRGLNGGSWLRIENLARNLSQQHHLFIIAGAVYGSATLKAGSAVYVPYACYKFIYDIEEHKYVFCGWFKNNDQGDYETLMPDVLASRIPYHVDTHVVDFLH